MKTLKKTLAILLFIFAVSCSKDNNVLPAPEPVVEQPISLLTKTIDSDGLISTYTYDNDKRLINYKLNGDSSNAPRDHNLTYNTDGTLAQITNVTDGSIISKYFYNADKKVVKKESRNGIDVYTYEYTNDQIIEKYLFRADDSKRICIYTKNPQGNVTQSKEFLNVTNANPNGTLSYTSNYTFDTKKSATTSLPKEYLFPENNVNNRISEQNNAANVYNYTMEYNTKGYPIKRITGYTRTYEYQ